MNKGVQAIARREMPAVPNRVEGIGGAMAKPMRNTFIYVHPRAR